jgi:predicted AlkP superfamily phosphohydrolase/phosphomutase
MSIPTKVLVLAIDAGDPELILEWSRDGSLPNLRGLLERGMWGLTVNPEGLFVGAVWPCFWTGLSPARHGRYAYRQLRPGSYEFFVPTPSDTRGRAFWETLSEQGRRVAIIDVPKTSPASRLNGIQLVDWGTHDPELGFVTLPLSLATDLESRFGPHPVPTCDAKGRSASEFTALRDGLVRGAALKARMAAHLLAQGPWDLFVSVFAESHCAGHQFWHVHDPTHPRHDPDLARALGDPIRDVYAAIDAGIGSLLAQAGDDTTVLVLASHGMGPHYDGSYLLDRILAARERAEVPTRTRTTARALEWGWERVPRPIRQLLRPLRTRTKRRLGEAVVEPDRTSKRCFGAPNNDVYGAIRVNLVGREPHGRVRPGEEYERFCAELERDLLALVNVDTGLPLVKQVLKTAEVYPDAPVDHLPDLMIEWNRGAPISNIYSPKTGTIRGEYRGNRTGDHKPRGLLVAAGPALGPGRFADPVDVRQLAPTIAALLGAALPDAELPPVPELAPALVVVR